MIFKLIPLFFLVIAAMQVHAQDDIESDLIDVEYCQNISKTTSVPRKIDQSKDLVVIKCEEKQYLARPTLAYTYVVTQPEMEIILRKSMESYRAEVFQERCRNGSGTNNRLNYKNIYLDKNKKKISELFISYYECLGAYDDKLTNGLGAEGALKHLEKITADFDGYRKETKLLLEAYQKLLVTAKLLLGRYKELHTSLESERLMRSIEALGKIEGGMPSTSNITGNRLIGPACFFVRSWSSGLNKNCVYNCVGSESTKTIGSAEICPSILQ